MKKSRLLDAVYTCLLSVIATSVHAVGVPGQGTWETTLLPRSLDSNLTTVEAYYDKILGITWLANADANGLMTWADAVSWTTSLDFGAGIDNWRLPDTSPIDGSEYDYSITFDGTSDRGYNISAPGTLYAGSTSSEMAHMFYITLGNLAYCDSTSSCPQESWGLTNLGPFINVQNFIYWSNSADGLPGDVAWVFHTSSGYQYIDAKTDLRYAWAVHDGDVGAAVVPIPTALWLFSSGLIGLMGMAGRNRLN